MRRFGSGPAQETAATLVAPRRCRQIVLSEVEGEVRESALVARKHVFLNDAHYRI